MARSSGEERRKCAQRFARGGDQRSPKAAHGGALPGLASRDYLARIVSTSRATSAIERAAALPNRATICARSPCLGRDEARDVPALMRDGRASVGRLLRDKRARWLSSWRRRERRRRAVDVRRFLGCFDLKFNKLDTIRQFILIRSGKTMALIPLLGIRIRPPAGSGRTIKN
ncbi:phosphoribosylanthranilate isomerase [Dorcoceras hygrometricum]|uniref:Phosphoribosylanthranilate isomerase n=1 Tax=Dorcoceras hygrometricum TaxID=472368 RepID=A0A2Z7A0U5_9LAMI|nr:phosphoribosylanthranilate isomerase [Dorcoceras hygrometricum]